MEPINMAGSMAGEFQYEQAHITDNATNSIIAANVICTVVAGSVVSLRLIARRLKRRSLGIDDYMAVLAMLFVFGFLATALFGLHVGSGKHIILSKDPAAYKKDAIAAQVIYATGVVPMKFSLIFLYRRIFPNRWLHVALWAIGGVVVCMAIAADCLAVFKCLPLKGTWDLTIQLRCINFAVWIIIHALHNVVTDFLLLCLPMPLVWRLNMTRTRKMQVSGIFALGAFASVASIIRITFLGAASSHYLDSTWADVPAVTWSMVELCMGITSACLPTLGPIVTYIRKSPSVPQIFPKTPFTPERATPKSAPKTTSAAKSTWTDFKARILDRSYWDDMFSHLEDNPQEDVERDWTPSAPFTNTLAADKGGVQMVAVRSCRSSIYEDDQSLNCIEVITAVPQQDVYQSHKL